MPVERSVLIDKFTRGLNTVKQPKDLLPGEFSELQNYYLLGGQLRYRPRIIGWWTRADSSPVDEIPITGLQTLAELTPGQWDLILLSEDRLARMNFGGDSTVLTDSMSLAFATNSTDTWQSVQYKGYGYAVRKDLTYILRFDDAEYWSNGIAAPSTAAVLADGGVGTGEAGTFYGVFTFVDADGVESDYSPVSNGVTVAANRYISWTSVDVSTNPRVVARNLYRTLPNQTGEYFYVTQIPQNTTGAWNEAVLTTNMGDLAPVGHTVQPAVNYVDIEVCFERLWATDGSYVYGSLPEDPDSFDPEYTYPFNPDDGEPIKAIKRLGSDLIVLKSGSIHALSQSLGAFEFLSRLIDEVNGTCSSRSVAVGDGKLFFYTGRAVMWTDGVSAARDVSTGRIAALSEATAVEAAAATGVFYEKMGWYVLALGGDLNYVYDSRRDYWFTLEYPPSFGDATMPLAGVSSLGVLHPYIDADGFTGVFAAKVGAPAIHDIFPTDYTDGSLGEGDVGGETGYYYGLYTGIPSRVPYPIHTKVRFPGIDFGAPGKLHAVTHFLLATDNPAELGAAETNRTLLKVASLYMDSVSSAAKTRADVVVVGSHIWKRFGLASGKKGHVSEVLIERQSNYELIISGFQLFGEVWNQEIRELT